MLKSDGFASNLSAPDGSGTLAEYCARNAIPYQDIADPVALQTFVAYGQDFQRRHVPFLTQCDVISVDRHGTGFRLVDAAGGSVFARVVVAAVGVTHFRVVPEVLAGLPSDLATTVRTTIGWKNSRVAAWLSLAAEHRRLIWRRR